MSADSPDEEQQNCFACGRATKPAKDGGNPICRNCTAKLDLANPDNSVSFWIQRLKEGDSKAPDEIWQRYHAELLRQAEKRLGQFSKRVADEEDIVLEAFDSLFKSAREGRLPNLNDRNGLWALMMTILTNKALDQIRRLNRKKRGPETRGDSVFSSPATPAPQSDEPTPEESAAFNELLQNIPLQLEPRLKSIFFWKLADLTNVEISRKASISVRTVERHLKMLRDLLRDLLDDDDHDDHDTIPVLS